MNGDGNKYILGKIAEAFLGTFSSIYYVNADTNEYQWYSVNPEFNSLDLAQSGKDFFVNMARDARQVIHPDDQHIFTEDLTKEMLLSGKQEIFIYRLMIDGKPLYHSMRLIKGGIHGEDNYFILTVRNVDTEYRSQLERDRLEKEKELFNQVAGSLARVYDTIYYVNTLTNTYSEFTSSNLLETLEKPEQGQDFFEKLKKDALQVIYPEDLEKVLDFLKKDNLMNNLHSNALTHVEYRLQMGETPVYVRLSGMLADDDVHVILCVENIDRHIRALSEAREQALKDPLTGVRNKKAYFELENSMQNSIDNGIIHPFAITVCDLNNLKLTNDTLGHKTGDELIRSACRLICDTYKYSPVFRIGGDEFAVVMTGHDYERREILLQKIRGTSLAHVHSGTGVIVAAGMSEFNPHEDHTVADVFKRADDLMYENKKELKAAM